MNSRHVGIRCAGRRTRRWHVCRQVLATTINHCCVQYVVSWVCSASCALKRVFFASLVIFCIGSAAQVCAQSVQDIIIGRAIGGLGVGALRCDPFLLFSANVLTSHLQHAFAAVHSRN